jgi:Uma2 family endonuclease
MIALADSRHYFSPEEYFHWESQQELRYEYTGGEVFAMAGGTISHSAIAVNLIALLRPYLRGSGCRVLGSDTKVGISKGGVFSILIY